MPDMSFRSWLLVALSLAARSLQQQSKNPLNDFCRRWGHQTAQVDGKLYIDGGLVAWNPLSTNPLNYTSMCAPLPEVAVEVGGTELIDFTQTHGSFTPTSTPP